MDDDHETDQPKAESAGGAASEAGRPAYESVSAATDDVWSWWEVSKYSKEHSRERIEAQFSLINSAVEEASPDTRAFLESMLALENMLALVRTVVAVHLGVPHLLIFDLPTNLFTSVLYAITLRDLQGGL